MEFEEIINDVKGALGDKGFIVLIIAIIAIFLIMLSKQSSEGQDETTMVVGLTSYPDAVTNANVIIDTLQDNIQYTEDNILDAIDSQGEAIGSGFESVNENISVNFEATNDYINKGFESQTDLIDKVGSDIIGDISSVNNTLGTMKSDVTTIKNDVKTITTNNTDATKKNTTNTSTKTTNTATKTSSSSKKSTTSYYTYKTKKGLNTSQSIVDALKAIGVDSSMSNRKKIAKANGISNYTGTYKQNVSLLGKLKSGKLKKV